MTLSRVIRNGLVYDGTGGEPRHADVGIEGDRIAVIGEIATVECEEIDATGLAVSPGFINILSHGWQTVQLDGSCGSDLVQGVTTEVFGEGVSPGPTSQALLETMPVPAGTRLDFPRLSDGLDHIESQGTSVNVASFLGGNNLRALAAGNDDRRLSDEELGRLCTIVDEEMEQGALGIATALIYAPESYWTTDDLKRLAAVVGRHDGLYISHLRSEGNRFLEALDELIDIGRSSSCRVELFHMKAAGSDNHHKMSLAIERIEAARASGQQITADMYPYLAGGTNLSAAIPPRYHDGGLTALRDRLADPEIRRQIVAEMYGDGAGFENLFTGADRGHGILFLSDLADGTAVAGRNLVEVAADLGIADPADALLEIVRVDPNQMVCYFVVSEENLQQGLVRPWVSIGSDAQGFGPDAATDAFVHPRAYGTFARILGYYSRDLKLMELTEAIRKMTSLPADTLRLKDRGRLLPGAFADLVVFDPATIRDAATYSDPQRYASGVSHVLVNGEPALADGQLLSSRPGRRLRRGR